jgi:hypothetical protein
MKIEVNQYTPKEKPFPKLMCHKVTGMVVLFNRYGKGTVIANFPPYREVGDYADNWNMAAYMDFEGEITIKS